jgi:sortase A
MLPKIRQLLTREQFFSRRILSLLLVTAGMILLTYVGYSYFSMYYEQQRLAERWEEQQRQAQAKTENASEVPVAQDDGLTRVSIPKISLDAIIVEGTSHKQLKLGPGHVQNTPTPGEMGNSVISAHRDTFFRHLYELNKGDDIIVKRLGRSFTYQVISKKIVEPDDTSVLAASSDAKLTLITCYPIYYIGPAPKRLVVVSKLVEPAPASKAALQPAAHAATP